MTSTGGSVENYAESLQVDNHVGERFVVIEIVVGDYSEGSRSIFKGVGVQWKFNTPHNAGLRFESD